MTLYSWAAWCAALIAAAFAGVLLVRRSAVRAHRYLAWLAGATAIANTANGLSLWDEAGAVSWKHLALVAELLQPGFLISAGLAYLAPTESNRSSTDRWRSGLVSVTGILLAAGLLRVDMVEWRVFGNGQAGMAITGWGRAAYVFLVVGMAMGIAQLEVVLRASREPARHRLKFIVIGLAGLAGYQVYQASQFLLLPVWRPEHVLVAALVTTMALGVTAFGLARSRLQDVFVNAYVSQQALFGSVTFLAIGGYLLLVGTVGTWLQRTNQPLAVGLSVVVVFGAVVALLVAAFSKTVRADIRRVLVRNFYRSKYDYRAHWLQVTAAFQEAGTCEAILDRLLDLLIKTFSTTSITIWTFREADRRFTLRRSMIPDVHLDPIELEHPVIVDLTQREDAVLVAERLVLGPAGQPAVDPLATSGAALCFPIMAHGRLVAFMALGKQRAGDFYGTDDCDLLRGIAHHVGALLSHAKLAEERQASAELEAVHRFSVFCMHDLKNLAARLSLVAQNAEHHGHDPSFQASAMRTVADTSQKMTALMSKLSLKSVKPVPPGSPEPIDLTEIVREIVAPLQAAGRAIQLDLAQDQPVFALRDHVHQVFSNLIINANQAVGAQGEVWVRSTPAERMLVITVRDNGPGISEAQMESLFQPAQSGRPGGLGIGLYQCKQIVESYRGTIHVRSRVGQGTVVQIEWPLSPPACTPPVESRHTHFSHL